MPSHRLPRAVLPRRYRLELEPDLDAGRFQGTVAIEAEVLEPVSSIVLNAAELDVSEALILAGGAERAAAVDLDEGLEQVRLDVDTPLAPGDVEIRMSFRGVLNDKLKGFYRSTFTDPDGATRTIATTQFQATDARRAFPCFDEPDMKAVFEVTLVVADGLLAVSNAAEVGREPTADGRWRVRFAPTIPLSTYLVAFVVGPLEATSPIDVDGVPVRVVHRPGQGHLTGFALDAAAAALRTFVDYYGIPYRGDKLDLVALPDFAAGAMENLGCITFREVLLLVDPATATQPELQNVADVVGHELAHLWFGDLVTMRWWNGIWLNEAFATFMEMKATDAFRPEWRRWDSFGLARAVAAEVDSLASTRPVEYEVVTPADADAMFDVLTYQKGAAVVRMLEQYLGEDVFRDGIRHYLRTHEYGNTETHDLWDAIEAVSGEPVRSMMDSWIFQGGYPVLEVRAADGRAHLAQKRFRLLPAEDGDRAQWIVPVRMRVDGSEVRTLLDQREAVVELPPGRLITANAGATGFYRVALDELPRPEDLAQLEAIERAVLVDDTWSLVLAGELPAERVLALADLLRAETDLTVWQRLLACLGQLARAVPDDAQAAYGARVRSTVRPALDQRGWVPAGDEADRERALRGTLIAAAGRLGEDAEVRARARQLLDEPGVDPEVRAAVVDVIAYSGTVEEFDEFRSRWKGATDPQEEQRFLNALADFPDAACIDQLCEWSLREIRSQDAPYVLRRALLNRNHGGRVWRFIAQHWDEVNARFPSSSIERMLHGVRTLSEPGLAAEITEFLSTRKPPHAARAIDQHLELLAAHTRLRQREAGNLSRLLS